MFTVSIFANNIVYVLFWISTRYFQENFLSLHVFVLVCDQDFCAFARETIEDGWMILSHMSDTPTNFKPRVLWWCEPMFSVFRYFVRHAKNRDSSLEVVPNTVKVNLQCTFAAVKTCIQVFTKNVSPYVVFLPCLGFLQVHWTGRSTLSVDDRLRV